MFTQVRIPRSHHRPPFFPASSVLLLPTSSNIFSGITYFRHHSFFRRVLRCRGLHGRGSSNCWMLPWSPVLHCRRWYLSLVTLFSVTNTFKAAQTWWICFKDTDWPGEMLSRTCKAKVTVTALHLSTISRYQIELIKGKIFTLFKIGIKPQIFFSSNMTSLFLPTCCKHCSLGHPISHQSQLTNLTLGSIFKQSPPPPKKRQNKLHWLSCGLIYWTLIIIIGR